MTDFAQESAFAAPHLWIVALLLSPRALVAGYFVLATRKIAAHAEKMVPPSGKFIDIDGNRIHYVEAGEGRPIVFIHGLGAQFHQFRHPLFGRLADSYRLVALDRPGSGYSVRAAGAGAGFSEQARIVVGFMEKLGLEKPLLVGHSLGGMVALAIAIEHPDRLSRARASGALTRYSDKVAPEFAPLHIAAALAALADLPDHRDPECAEDGAATLDFIFGPQPMPADYSDRRRRLFGAAAEPFLRDVERPRRERRWT